MVKDFAGNKDYIQKLNAIEKSREAYVKGHNTPPGVPTQKGLTGDVEFISEAYPVVEFGNYDIPEGWENALAKPTQTGVPAQWENPNTTGFESNGEEETNLYFFHTDHLGSTNYLTDKDGVVQQSIVYQPYGEVLYEEKTYSNPYKFNGKELDTETGLAYYGARYYSPELGVWYGVDPLMEKYPASSPYVFCAGNPVRFVDVDGRKITFVGAEKDKETVCNIINESMGGFAKVTIPKRGPMIIENTNKEGQSTDMQQNSINEWSKIINGEGNATINIHRNNPTILIGSYAKETIDIQDIESIGSENVITSVGTLIHECSEQYYKQTQKNSYEIAHKKATSVESIVSGVKIYDERTFVYDESSNTTYLEVQYKSVEMKLPRKIQIEYSNNNNLKIK